MTFEQEQEILAAMEGLIQLPPPPPPSRPVSYEPFPIFWWEPIAIFFGTIGLLIVYFIGFVLFALFIWTGITVFSTLSIPVAIIIGALIITSRK